MRMSYRALARLLCYPNAGLRGALPEIRAALHAESRLTPRRRVAIDALFNDLASGDELEIEASYVQTFDRGRAQSLHLFEHVHGDSRDRGQAMVDLAATYAQAGMYLAGGELPDFLPIALEFASTQPDATADAFVAEFAHILNRMHSALARHGSRYAAVLAAIIEIAGEDLDAAALEPEQPLDVLWEEPVAFDGCPTSARPRDGVQPIHFHHQGASS